MIRSKQLPFPIKKYAAGVIRNNFIQTPGIAGEFPGDRLIGLPRSHLYSRLMDQMLNVCRAIRLSHQRGEQGMQLLGLTKQVSIQDELQIFL